MEMDESGAQHLVAEVFWPGATEALALAAMRRLRECCDVVAAQGMRATFLSGSFVVDDESLICRFEGTAEAVARAHELAGLHPDRLLAARDADDDR